MFWCSFIYLLGNPQFFPAMPSAQVKTRNNKSERWLKMSFFCTGAKMSGSDVTEKMVHNAAKWKWFRWRDKETDKKWFWTEEIKNPLVLVLFAQKVTDTCIWQRVPVFCVQICIWTNKKQICYQNMLRYWFWSVLHNRFFLEFPCTVCINT